MTAKDTKMVAYVPTYRDEKVGDFFTKAIPDIDRLIKVCEENHLLFVFKMHQYAEILLVYPVIRIYKSNIISRSVIQTYITRH